MTNILTAFNEHFIEFINDIQMVFPEDIDILTAKNALLGIRKANPKMIVKIWSTFSPFVPFLLFGLLVLFFNKYNQCSFIVRPFASAS